MPTSKSYLLNLYPNLALTQLAKLWAEADENIEVEAGKFSAKHHSILAAAAALEAAASALQSAADASATAEDLEAIELIYSGLQPIAENIAEVLAVQENVLLFSTVEPFLTDLASIHSNITALLAVHADLVPLNVVNDNILALNEIADNLSQILAAAEGAESIIAAVAAAEQHAIDANAGKAAFENMLLEAQQLYLDMANNYFFYPEVNALRLRVFNEEAEYLLPLRLVDASLDALQSIPHSLLMLPFAAKAGKIYSILPADGSGDLVVSRNSVKTVIGKNGLPVECAVNTLMLDYTTGVPGFLIENGTTNLIANPLAPVTQDIEVAYVNHYLQFRGSGTIVFSGVRNVTVIGNADGSLKQTTINPTAAGTLTLTISGVVRFAQLEVGGYSSFVNGTRAADVVTVPLTGLKSYVRNDYLYLYENGIPNPFTLPLGLTKRLIFSDIIFTNAQIQALNVVFEPVDPINITLSTGDNATQLNITVSEITSISLSGNGFFSTDYTGVVGVSKVWILLPNANRSMYLNFPSGVSVMTFPNRNIITAVGTSTVAGWNQHSVYPKGTLPVNLLSAVTTIHVSGYATITGNLLPIVTTFITGTAPNSQLHEGLLVFKFNPVYALSLTSTLPSTLIELLIGNQATWSSTQNMPPNIEIWYLTLSAASSWVNSEAMPSTLKQLHLSGNTINYTPPNTAWPTGITYIYVMGYSLIHIPALDFTGTGNITTLFLQKWRTVKLTDADMLTILASLQNRVGTLPATITIRDYTNANTPPQSVVDAIASLKAAKSITTVTLGT